VDFPFGEMITLVRRTVTGQDGDGNDVYGETLTDVSGAFDPAVGFRTHSGHGSSRVAAAGAAAGGDGRRVGLMR